MTRGHRQFADAAVDENGLYRPDDAAHSPVSLLLRRQLSGPRERDPAGRAFRRGSGVTR